MGTFAIDEYSKHKEAQESKTEQKQETVAKTNQ